ncbi:MAG: hypothetical protein L0387_16775 [Acidobacteria bacterium]|nr:hypothetical protein [Acidobacteriota bacterium]MCI0722204.1 hypothetical protein [Acidobacteriota bacterium]
MIKRCSIAGISILGTLFLLEAGVRLYSLFFYPKMTEFDSKLGWKHAVNKRKVFRDSLGQENVVVHNAYGHRGQAYGYRKAHGKFRALILGDSFADGQLNEEDLFSARLEKECPRLEAINAGVSGYGTVQEYLYLRSEGLKFDPDMVMVLFFENDLTDNCLSYFPTFGPRPYANFANGKFQIDETLDPRGFDKFALPVPFRMILQRWSYLYYFFNTKIYHRVFSEKLAQAHYADLRSIADSEKYDAFSQLINRMNIELSSRNIQLLLVFAPTREDVHRGTSETIKRLMDLCRVRQIQCLSLLDRLIQENRRNKELYYPVDIHWTRYGHQVAADEVGRYLRRFCDSPITVTSSN